MPPPNTTQPPLLYPDLQEGPPFYGWKTGKKGKSESHDSLTSSLPVVVVVVAGEDKKGEGRVLVCGYNWTPYE